jgi:cbb3-type cytochrome oxidase subunit 3
MLGGSPIMSYGGAKDCTTIPSVLLALLALYILFVYIPERKKEAAQRKRVMIVDDVLDVVANVVDPDNK